MCTHLFDEPVVAFVFFFAAARETSILGECFILEREGGKRLLHVNKVVTRFDWGFDKVFQKAFENAPLQGQESCKTTLAESVLRVGSFLPAFPASL